MLGGGGGGGGITAAIERGGRRRPVWCGFRCYIECGSVVAMYAEQSRAGSLATVELRRKRAQSRVCT